jgi:hypothetical protein
MTIKIYPEDIVKMCLWDNYVYYIINSDKEAETILKENKEFEISEREALIIGLLKDIKTDNLIHKFNKYVIEILTVKSIKDKEVLIRKKTFDFAVNTYMNKFPKYWEPDLMWKNSIKELSEYITGFKEKLQELELYKSSDENIIHDFYNTNNIKKILKFNY